MLFSAQPTPRNEESLSKKRGLVIRKRQLRHLAQVDRQAPLDGVRFAVIDLETTGLHPRSGDAILAVGGVRIVQGRVHLRDRFFSYVNPERPIPPKTIRIHQIVPDMVEGAPKLGPVLRRFLSWCEGDVIVGHHVQIDLAFLDTGLKRWAGAHLLNPWVDVVRLAQVLAKAEHPSHRLQNLSLEHLATRYQIPIDSRHTALGDALTTAGIFLAQLKTLRGHGVSTLRGLLSLGGVRRSVRPWWQRLVLSKRGTLPFRTSPQSLRRRSRRSNRDEH